MAKMEYCGDSPMSRRRLLTLGGGLWMGGLVLPETIFGAPDDAVGKISGCTEIYPKRKDLAKAARTAKREGNNPPRLPLNYLRSPSSAGRSPFGRALQIALQKSKLWKNRNKLRVTFLSRNSELEGAVQTAARQWQEQIRLSFEFVGFQNTNAEVKVDFEQAGHWSYVGTDILDPPTPQTLNIEPDVPDENYLRVALHELGHTLGAIHEHQSPAANIPWDRPKVFAYYKRTQDWSREETQFQVLDRYNGGMTNSKFDRRSIMLYPISTDLLQPGSEHFAVDWNNELSETDKTFIATKYPRDPEANDLNGNGEPDKLIDKAAAIPLTIAKPRTRSITKYAQVDVYKFTVSSESPYTVETIESPPINMVLELYTDDDSGGPLETKTYGGRGLLNARIERLLPPATYYVRAYHRNRPGRGTYRVVFRRR